MMWYMDLAVSTVMEILLFNEQCSATNRNVMLHEQVAQFHPCFITCIAFSLTSMVPIAQPPACFLLMLSRSCGYSGLQCELRLYMLIS